MPKRTDENQQSIVKALRGIGCAVVSLHTVGKGVPDLLVGFRNINILIEVKTATGKLTNEQVKFHADWRGQIAVVRTPIEAIELVSTLTLNNEVKRTT